jgi:hypothetical protein
MSEPVFLATLGQRPEAITMALDALLPRYGYHRIGVLHTDPVKSGIADALRDLLPVLERDYPEQETITHELRMDTHTPLIDITNRHTAEGYFHSLAEVVRQYRQQYITVHLLVSGGRKAMSIYATVAATYLFGEHDRVWTVLTDAEWMQPRMFHLPPGYADAVQVVSLPLLPVDMPPGAMTTLDRVLKRRSPRERFLAALTPQERVLADTLMHHPYASNDELGALLDKTNRTVENQLRSMYRKMSDHFDIDIQDRHKRQVLIDILSGRV